MVSPDSDAVETSLRAVSEAGCAGAEGAGAAPAAERRPFEAVYREHFAFVWRTLRRLGVWPANLDDAAQEVFVVVHRRYAEFRPGTSEKAWLFAISQRVASDQRRTRRRKGGLLPLNETVPAGGLDPFDQAARSQASDLVLGFLDTLDDDQRSAFILSDLEQMTAKEIADSLGANINTVYYRIAAARKQFAAFVDRRRAAEQERQP
jgi:RNA polymerase sigma-70 factor (ECF subfamily)